MKKSSKNSSWGSKITFCSIVFKTQTYRYAPFLDTIPYSPLPGLLVSLQVNYAT